MKRKDKTKAFGENQSKKGRRPWVPPSLSSGLLGKPCLAAKLMITQQQLQQNQLISSAISQKYEQLYPKAL